MMRILNTAVAQPRVFFSGVIAGAAVLAIGYLLALMGGQASATHGGSGNIHACLSLFTNQIRVMAPGQAPNCKANEMLIEWPSAAITTDLSALEARIATLEGQVPDCLIDNGTTALFDGCNVQIVSGEGTTFATPNGLGNLIVGYNENPNNAPRTGSHNIVMGANNGYSSYGGLVAGVGNLISGAFASVSGGNNNTASGSWASVTGGVGNTASGSLASVNGGSGNVASGNSSSVSGGAANSATGDFASVTGGNVNIASGDLASVTGGVGNTASDLYTSVSGGQLNDAISDFASVSGGVNNTASGDWSSVSGGGDNIASGLGASITGGLGNAASGSSSSVSGGQDNSASGFASSVSGGDTRTAPGDHDWVAGGLFQDF